MCMSPPWYIRKHVWNSRKMSVGHVQGRAIFPTPGPPPTQTHSKTTPCKHPTPIQQMKKQGNPQPEKRGCRSVNVRAPPTHALRTTRANSKRPMTSRINLPNRDPRNRASHTQSPTLAASTPPNKRALSCVNPLQCQTRCSLEKSSPQSGQGAHSSGSQGTLNVPR